MNTIVQTRNRNEHSEAATQETYPARKAVNENADNSQVIRRFYQVRDEKNLKPYELNCSLKQYLLEQKKTAAMLKHSSSRNDLEEMIHIYPDTGAFSFSEQEYHDLDRKGRDHFLVLGGTGEELAIAEEYFVHEGFKVIDAKTCSSEQNLKSFLGSFTPFHRDAQPDVIQRITRNIRHHLIFYGCVAATVYGAAAMISPYFENKPLTAIEAVQGASENKEIIGASYSFSTKNYKEGKVIAANENLANYLKARYPKVEYSISVPRYYSELQNSWCGSVDGIISGDAQSVREIKAFIEKGTSLGIKTSHLSYIYQKADAAASHASANQPVAQSVKEAGK